MYSAIRAGGRANIFLTRSNQLPTTFRRTMVAVKKGNTSAVNRRKGQQDQTQSENEAIQSFIKFAEEAKRMKIEFTSEEEKEHFRIGREYQRQMTIRNNKMEKDLTTKIWLQQEAMRALPPDLYAHAIIIDETPPPEERPLPLWDTPPIKGFNPQDYLKNEDNDDARVA